MTRLCMRSRCDRAAQVRLTYDTLQCHVWLDHLPVRSGMVQEICDFHAMRLTLPLGWVLVDRRTKKPTLFDLEDMVTRPPVPEAPAFADIGSGADIRSGAGIRSDVRVATAPHNDPLDAPSVPHQRPRARAYRGRHPAVNASELFSGYIAPSPGSPSDPSSGSSPETDITVVLGDLGQSTAADDELAVVAIGDRSIERVILLGSSDSIASGQ